MRVAVLPTEPDACESQRAPEHLRRASFLLCHRPRPRTSEAATIVRPPSSVTRNAAGNSR